MTPELEKKLAGRRVIASVSVGKGGQVELALKSGGA